MSGFTHISLREKSGEPPAARPSSISEEMRGKQVHTLGVQVSVHRQFTEIENVWRQFEQTANASCYQRFDFVSSWFDNIGKQQGFEPYIVVGQTDAGIPAFIWPFVSRTELSIRFLCWPGGKHSNYNLGLTDPDWCVSLNRTRLDLILREANEQFPFDAITLYNQPEVWNGQPNPFAQLPHSFSPSFAYCIDLRDGFDNYITSFRSSRFRKRMRWQFRTFKAMARRQFCALSPGRKP